MEIQFLAIYCLKLILKYVCELCCVVRFCKEIYTTEEINVSVVAPRRTYQTPSLSITRAVETSNERSAIWNSLQNPELWRGQWRVASNQVQLTKRGEGEWPCHRYSVVHVPLANEGYVTKTWKERWMRNGGQNTYMQNLVLWKWDLHVTHGHINRISFLLATVICNWSWGHENWHARTLMLRDRNRAESYMQRLQNFGIWESFLH